ncbi:glycosyltransferase [Pedobacter sp.]|uniref:glycosyltransferase n=1 Tax=Pedobacter sp. TaxID=1411316 RepID=UPI003D7FC0DF
MNVKRILIIGMVWPEPTSSAAGTRMIQLINLFLSTHHEVYFACAASKSDFSFPLQDIGVIEQPIILNDSGFNLLLKQIDPEIVLFDRFMIEEQYGWRVQQECPDALRLLDTEDLHFLRHARQQAIKTGQSIDQLFIHTDMAKREIASILRCDLSLIISEVEIQILEQQFHIADNLIYYLPFLEDELSEQGIKQWINYEEREGFVFIGNYLHEPNWHTLQYLKTKIWPEMRKRLPKAAMHIYGAYAAPKVMQLHNEKERFFVHGRAADARTIISKHKVLLAPIQFGAGVKGKFIDAMQVGTPTVTTSIGAEAMKGNLDWNGIIADEPDHFIAAAVNLYEDKYLWHTSQQNGIRILNQRYGKAQFNSIFMERIQLLIASLQAHRQQNFFGQLLQYHTASSTKYMSLWIEEKNKNRITAKDLN